MSIIETTVACDLITDEIGLFERFFLIFKFHLGHHQSGIVAIELIYLERMAAVGTGHQVAGLVDNPWLAHLHQMVCLVERNLLLELIARESAVERRPFDGEIAMGIADANPDGASVPAHDITLPDTAFRGGLLAVSLATYQKFPLDFQSTHGIRKS